MSTVPPISLSPRQAATSAAATDADLLAILRRPFLIGRSLLLLLQVAAGAVLLLNGQLEAMPGGAAATILFLIYDAITLVAARALPIRRSRISALLVLDVCAITATVHFTGGSRSPFLGQFYFVIYVAAMFFGLRGGLAAGICSAVVAGVMVMRNPVGLQRDMTDFLPYFAVAGAFAGYLGDGVKTWFDFHQQSRERERETASTAAAARRELDLAHDIQRTALPATVPKISGLEFGIHSEPAREVGGDFHAFLSADADHPQRIVLIVGDVSGKGVPAALTATSIAYVLPMLRPLIDTRSALATLNADLALRLPTRAFVTLGLADVDLSAGCIRMWSAGHPPALFWRKACGTTMEVTGDGPLLGVFPEWEGEPTAQRFDAGDILVLYSDGLIEARTADPAPDGYAEQFGVERAAAVLAANAHRSANEIARALADAVHEWGATLADDLTILVCKRSVSDSDG
jgi:serine phosphatase RsbU (regulator of sigma subunit)